MKIVGLMVAGPNEGERELPAVLEKWKTLVDDAIICGNNTDKETEKVIAKSGFWFYRDDRTWGIHQPRIKSDLLHKVAKLKPDWVLPTDADEVYDTKFTRQEAEKLAEVETVGYYFAIINLWDDANHYRHDLSFWNIRYFKFIPSLGLHYERKNLHCGLAPPWAYKYGMHAPFMVKHYGLMKPEIRRQKVERYEKYDPNAKYKGRDYYDALKDNKFVREFDEEEMHNRIVSDVASYDEKPKNIHSI